MSTLTHYAQLKAYWFNPRNVKVRIKCRDFRDRGTLYHRRDILTKLECARAKLDGRDPNLDFLKGIV